MNVLISLWSLYGLVILAFSSVNIALVKKGNLKITSFSKTTLLQREPFLTLFYTINPITRYQDRFYANIYFE